MEYLKKRGHIDGMELVSPEPAGLQDIKRVHSGRYIESVRALAESGGGDLDPDTPVSRGSFDAAVLAAGAAVGAAESVLDGEYGTAFALVRPPGHHATHDRGMGFCLFDNVAIAAKRLLDVRGLKRVAILDFDVHHGNGTEEAFRNDARGFFVSFHRHPFYPGSGAPISAPAHIVDVPLKYDTPSKEFLARWSQVLEEKVKPFAPEMVLVSAGFDCFQYDPVGGLNFEVKDYRRLGEAILGLARECCGGKVASVLEGGYDLEGLPRCLEAYLEGIGAIGDRLKAEG